MLRPGEIIPNRIELKMKNAWTESRMQSRIEFDICIPSSFFSSFVVVQASNAHWVRLRREGHCCLMGDNDENSRIERLTGNCIKDRE